MRFTLAEPEVVADPFPTFRILREEDPAHWSDYLNGWILTRYVDVKRSLLMSVERVGPFMDQHRRKSHNVHEDLANIGLWTTFNDPPYHTRLRRLLSRALTPRFINDTQTAIEHIIAGLVRGWGERTTIDIMANLAHGLPCRVVVAMLGLPREDTEQLRIWADQVNLFVGGVRNEEDKYSRAARGIAEITAYFRNAVASRRKGGYDDLISRMIWARDRGDFLNDEEIVAACVNLTHAGQLTTANLIGNAVAALLRHPDQMSKLRADPELLPGAVEEMLRYDGPVQAMVRIADEDVIFHGRTIRRGDRVFPMLNAANRDPAQFPDPDTFNVMRTDNKHIVFGYGPHLCMGVQLARMEIPIALAPLLDPSLTVIPDGEPTWIQQVAFRGPAHLPVRVIRNAPSL